MSQDRANRPPAPEVPTTREEPAPVDTGSGPQGGELKALIFDYLEGEGDPEGKAPSANALRQTPQAQQTQMLRGRTLLGTRAPKEVDASIGRVATRGAPAAGAAPGKLKGDPAPTEAENRHAKTDPDIVLPTTATFQTAPPSDHQGWRADDAPSPGAAAGPGGPGRGAAFSEMPMKLAGSDPEARPRAREGEAAVVDSMDSRPTIVMATPYIDEFEGEEPDDIHRAATSSLVVVGKAGADNVQISYRGILVSAGPGEMGQRRLAPLQLPPPSSSRDDDEELAPDVRPIFRNARRLEIDPRLYVRVQPGSAMAAAYRSLRDGFLGRGLPKVLAVTSANDKEGKTTTAGNLALAFAEQPDFRVLLVEAQHRTADLARVFGIVPPDEVEARPAIRVRPYDVVRFDDRIDIACIHSGPDQAVAAFDRRNFAAALGLFRMSKYDCILVDCGSVLESTSTPAIVEACDATLLVARAGRSSAHAIKRAVEIVGQERLFGITLVGA